MFRIYESNNYSFHKRVEDEMKKMKQVLDFKDFNKACIAAHGIALEMSDDDFYEYGSKVSKGKDTNYPYLDHIVVVQFRRVVITFIGRLNASS